MFDLMELPDKFFEVLHCHVREGHSIVEATNRVAGVPDLATTVVRTLLYIKVYVAGGSGPLVTNPLVVLVVHVTVDGVGRISQCVGNTTVQRRI